MKVAKWGNSLAIRLPAALVEQLQLKEGDEIDIGVAGSASLGVAKAMTRAEKVERMREILRGTLPPDYKFDREEANKR